MQQLTKLRVNVYVTILFTSQICFCLETERKFKTTFKRIVKFLLRFRKTIIIHQKFIFERNNFAKNDLHTPPPAQFAEMTTTTTTTTTLTSFPFYQLY